MWQYCSICCKMVKISSRDEILQNVFQHNGARATDASISISFLQSNVYGPSCRAVVTIPRIGFRMSDASISYSATGGIASVQNSQCCIDAREKETEIPAWPVTITTLSTGIADYLCWRRKTDFRGLPINRDEQIIPVDGRGEGCQPGLSTTRRWSCAYDRNAFIALIRHTALEKRWILGSVVSKGIQLFVPAPKTKICISIRAVTACQSDGWKWWSFAAECCGLETSVYHWHQPPVSPSRIG